MQFRGTAKHSKNHHVMAKKNRTVTSSNVLRMGSLQTKLNAGFSEQQQEDLFQSKRSFHEVKTLNNTYSINLHGLRQLE